MDWFTIAILVLILILVGVFLVREKLLSLLSKALKVILALSILLALVALFIPGLFSDLANSTLIHDGTLDSIRSFDKSISINSIIQPGKNLLDQFVNLFNSNPTPTPAVTPTASTSEKGPLETQLYPTLVSSLTLIYRVVALLIAVGGMTGVIYLSFSEAGALENAELQKRYRDLEKRLEILEKQDKLAKAVV